MIDLHSHLLPRIDDGAASLEDSLNLVNIAVEDGITHSVITPHIHLGRYDNDTDSIRVAYRLLKQALEERYIPFSIAFAAEVRIDPAVLAMIDENQVPFLGVLNGYKILLLEFPHSSIIPGTIKFIEHLLARNIRPLIAHPERNKAVLDKLDRIVPIRMAGAMLQVTGRSITGGFGRFAQRCAIEMLENNWVDVVATDAHNLIHRPPVLRDAYRFVKTRYGEQRAETLFLKTPAAISSVHFGSLGT